MTRARTGTARELVAATEQPGFYTQLVAVGRTTFDPPPTIETADFTDDEHLVVPVEQADWVELCVWFEGLTRPHAMSGICVDLDDPVTWLEVDR